MAEITARLVADFSQFEAQMSELKSLALEAGDIPEGVLKELRGLAEHISEELTFGRPVSTGATGEMVVLAGFRQGGRFDRCAAALRALRNRG